MTGLKHTADDKRQSGFTLIEVAIVVLISSVILLLATSIYERYQTERVFQRTQTSVDVTQRGIERFFYEYERFPCVASFSVPIDDPDFGKALDCTDESVPVGTCTADYCVAQDAATGRRVRIGSIPLQTIAEGIDDPAWELEKYKIPFIIRPTDTLDGYGSRLTYAVTERQATARYTDGAGGVAIRDEWDRPLRKSDFVLLSHGADQSGAIMPDGTYARRYDPDCSKPGRDRNNCNWRTPAALNDWFFVDALKNNREGDAAYYDDSLYHLVWKPFYLWETYEAHPQHSYNKNPGNVGIGLNDPTANLHVRGNAQSFKEIKDGVADTEPGNVNIIEVCDANGANCFTPEMVGGTDATACPGGYGAQGIRQGNTVCDALYKNNYAFSCPAGKYIKSFTYNINARTLSHACGP